LKRQLAKKASVERKKSAKQRKKHTVQSAGLLEEETVMQSIEAGAQHAGEVTAELGAGVQRETK
jgi:hypothetical protein